ncbi:hypothetical protein [Ralstonia pickettii]|uniref:hypothetical protein n=1 Tax=Ralstonia pickettii TaxID=329 RepID=UPI0015B937E6|nr:hypothetical protein [Ralstonia pickettii]NWK43817.1 hypothetical protein [Ralstonia pickettii]
MTNEKYDLSITFGDVIDFLSRHGRMLTALTVLGGLTGLCSSFIAPKQWEARTVIQVGQIYSGTGSATQIEPSARAAERLKLAPFVDEVLRHLNLPTTPGVNVDSDIIRSSATIEINRGADLLELSIRGYSPEDSRRFIAAYQNQLLEIHAALARPSIDRIRRELTDVNRALTEEEESRQRLKKLSQQSLADRGSKKFSADVLLNQMAQQNETQLQLLRLKKSTLEEQIDPQRTFNTRPLGDIAVSKLPAFPKRSVFSAGGTIFGIILALIIGLFKDFRRKLKR